MSKEELRKGFYISVVLTLVIFLMCPVVYAFGVRSGKRSADNWETTKVHHEMSVDGYNYCPYCGEEIKAQKEV